MKHAPCSWALAVLLCVTFVAAQTLTGLHVVGNQIQNSQGQVVKLIGVNRSGGEYACVQGWGFWDGPMGLSLLHLYLTL
jgi:hypothetical protein